MMEDDTVQTTFLDITLSSAAARDSARLLQAVISTIKRDLVAADVKWSLLVAASQSYKHDSCLRPFPPMFLTDGIKDVTALSEAIECVPSFHEMDSSAASLSTSAVQLLHWVLVELRQPSLTTVDKSEVDDVLGLVPCELSAPRPSLVMRLEAESLSAGDRRWSEGEQLHGSLYAFHGSCVENFHSILHHGLQQHLTKNAIFGQGVYLSSELLVCLPYSRTGLLWHKSCLGSECSVTALCQIVDHPSMLCQDKGGNEENKSRARAEDSLAGEVPHKLYVVPNSDLIRVRYLLIYTAGYTTHYSQRSKQRQGFLPWLGRHKMAAALVAYGVLLASVGLSRSPSTLRLWQVVCHLFGNR